jgi:hypothetical protein
MKKAIWMIMILLLVAGAAWAKDFTLTKKAGDLTVDIKIDKNPPVVGNNNMMVGIKDASGKEVTDAKVAVDYGMPAMPGMPAMNYKTYGMLHGSLYHAIMNLSMSGSWNVTVKINRQGKTVSTKFSIDAR